MLEKEQFIIELIKTLIQEHIHIFFYELNKFLSGNKECFSIYKHRGKEKYITLYKK